MSLRNGMSMDNFNADKARTGEDLVDAIERDSKRFSDALNGDDIPEGNVIPQQFREHRDAKLCWNLVLEHEDRTLIQQEGNAAAKKRIIKLALDFTMAFKNGLRQSIRSNVELIVSLGAEKALMLFKVYLSLVRTVPLQDDKRKSIDALSDKSAASAAQIVAPLTAEHVHYNMFTSGGFRVQDFARFDFPENFEQGLPQQYDKVVEQLDIIQQFLNHAKPRAAEQLTQAVFSLFMERFLKVFHVVEGIPESTRCAVAPVTEMTPVSVPVVISEQYMRDNEQMRKVKNRDGTFLYDGSGDWPTTLSIQSDLVLYPLSTSCEGSGKALQQDLFRTCYVNIEMKRFRLLVGKVNRQSMTQVSAESLARKSLLDKPKALFSLLTDHRGFYFLCHFVTEEDQPDQYLISRQETNPRRVVFLIRWLLKTSQEAGDMDELQKWLRDHLVTSGDDDLTFKENAGKKRSADEGEDSPMDHGGPPSKRSKCGSPQSPAVVVTLDQLFGFDGCSDDSSLNSGPDWDFFYAQQMQRQTTRPFQFSGGPLVSHTE